MAKGGSVDWDAGALDSMLRSPSGEVGEDVQRRGRAVLGSAQSGAPVRTGELRGGLVLEPVHIGPNGAPMVTIASTAPHTMFVEKGTGLYGRGMTIRPVSARVLSWSDGGRVFSRQSSGRRATPFLADSIDAADD